MAIMSVTAVPLRPIKRSALVKFWIALTLLVLAAGAIAWAGTEASQFKTTPSGLQYRVLKEGSGPSPALTDVALIDYTGRLVDGTIFDSTKGKQPVPMPVQGSIPGFSEGLRLMNKGASYRFKIPPELGYGEQGAGGVIPPNATLDFEVTLHEFLPMAALQGMMGPQGQPQQAPAGPPEQQPLR
jgi:FKBP-type peptidyl-prolyl cis-trans isomerase FkpA